MCRWHYWGTQRKDNETVMIFHRSQQGLSWWLNKSNHGDEWWQSQAQPVLRSQWLEDGVILWRDGDGDGIGNDGLPAGWEKATRC